MSIRRISQIILVISVYVLPVLSQSIYSTQGLGLFSNTSNARALGMGYASIAVHDQIATNISNPALWVRYINTSLNGNLSGEMIGTPLESFKRGRNTFSGFSFRFPVFKKHGFVMGLMPLTSIYFTYAHYDTIMAFGQSYPFKQTLFNTGGMSAYYLGSGYAVNERLSLGIRFDFIFGNYYEDRELLFTNTGELIHTRRKIRFSGERVNFGYFYHGSTYSLGGVFTKNFHSRAEILLDYSSGPDKTQRLTGNATPDELRTALTIQPSEEHLLTLESGFQFFDEDLYQRLNLLIPSEVRNTYNIGVGYEFSGLRKEYLLPFLRNSYRLGYYYRNQYFVRDGEGVQEYGFSFGIGIPFQKGTDRLDLAVVFGSRRGYLGQESFTSFQVSFSANERWFVRSKTR